MRHYAASVGIPSGLCLPPDFGIYTRRTGLGVHDRDRSCAQLAHSDLSRDNNTVLPSTPAVFRPAFSSVTRRTLSRALAWERSISFCRLRTFFRSPACDAAKIRCRSRRTSSSTCRQSTASQSRGSPSGPFTTASVTAAAASVMASNLSLGSDAPGHQVFAGSPDARQRPFRPGHQDPYPGGYTASSQGGCGVRCRFPVAFRHPGLRFSRHPVPAEELKLTLRSAYQALPPGPQRGCHVSQV